MADHIAQSNLLFETRFAQLRSEDQKRLRESMETMLDILERF